MRKKDKAAFAFAAVCALLIGVMMLHDLLELSLIDRCYYQFTLLIAYNILVADHRI